MLLKVFKKTTIMMLAMCTLIATIFLVQINAEDNKEDRIHFIDVGVSDSFLIESNGHYGLVDASDPTYNPYTGKTKKNDSGAGVVRYLNSLGVDH